MTTTFKIAGVQMNVALADPESNLQRMLASLEQTASAGAYLTIFPECAISGYCFESLEEAMPVAEPVPGPSCQAMIEACQRLNVYTIIGLLEADGDRLFNTAVLIGPDGLIGRYRKTHLPFLGIDRFTTSGAEPFEVFEAGDLRVGINICYDGVFPEPARVLALKGADLIALPTNWPPGARPNSEHPIHCRAWENRVFYAAVNRIGREGRFDFIGCSKICGVVGQTLAVADHDQPAILYAEIDLAEAREKRITVIPGEHETDRFNDRRPDLYGPVTE